MEAVPADGLDGELIVVRDRTGLSPAVLTVSRPVVFILSMFDGKHTLAEVQTAFAARTGQALSFETLAQVVGKLEETCLLEGESFDAYYGRLVAEYRASPARPMLSAAAMGLDGNCGAMFDDMLARHGGGACTDKVTDGVVVRGLIAPHLDYPRGAPCYGRAYGRLRDRATPERIVILGTNHFGLSPGVVATGNDFATPLGVSRCDVAFIERLEARIGPLRESELDHLREHSIELQVLWCQHLFGAETFRIVPALCPDPCGAEGVDAGAGAGGGVGLRAYAEALGELLAEDRADTLVIAGADLSHVGANFGDDRVLDDDFLAEVRRRDGEALDHVAGSDPAGFVARVGLDDNPTRVCSAGCVYALMKALPAARIEVLDYHQAVDPTTQTCVTCAAAVAS